MPAAVPNPEFRNEVKFVARSSERHSVAHWIRENAAGFRCHHPDRQVNNIYFDTYDYSAYRENLSGVSRRAKVRFRWYGETDTPESGVLEIKRRRGRIGWKDTHPVGGLGLDDRWSKIRRSLRSQLSAPWKLWFDSHPQPVLINRYRRRYFVSGDARIRVTLDWDQRVFDQRRRNTPNLERASNAVELLVVEFKFAPDDHPQASRCIQGIPLRVSRNSKYTGGVLAIAER
jgi:SPX domain protein involved in polyphosphate accumulation